MRSRLITSLVGAMIFTESCWSLTPVIPTKTDATKVVIKKNMTKLEAAGASDTENKDLGLKDTFLNTLKEKGPDLITNVLTSAGTAIGKELAFKLLQACGIDLTDDTSKALDNIYKELKEISTKIDLLNKKTDQYHSENIMNQVFKYVDYINNNLKPMLTSGIKTIVDDEKSGTKDEKELEEERVKYYNDNLKNRTFENGALLANYITDFAKAIVTPNDSNQPENIFSYYRSTLGKDDKWSYQEYKNERNFIACLESALLIGANLSMFDIHYRANGCEQATVNTYNEYLNNLINSIKDVNTLFQKELKRLDEVENDRVKNHIITYLPTNTQYSTRLATLTFNYEDMDRAGLIIRSKSNEYEFTFEPDSNLINSVNNDYIEYRTRFKDSNYTINNYLKEAGFYSLNSSLFDNAAGLYKGGLEHVRTGLYNHDTEIKAKYFDQLGKEQKKEIYKVNVYHNWIGEPSKVRVDNLDRNYYLVFMKPNDKELAGYYKDSYFNNVREQDLVKKFPFEISGNKYMCKIKAEVKAKF